jgi:uncharacterized protein (TIGR03437 family)
VRRTGAPVDDNGATCFACHRDGPPVNQGGGNVRVGSNDYIPGVKQNVSITITDPTALRWGYQITSRLVSDETKQAGSFTATDLVRVRCASFPVNPADGEGRDAPCRPGDQQFAEHRAASTRAGSGGPSQTFVLEWTPPADDVGPIVFYVAANAANNNNTFTGDHIYTASLRINTAGCNLAGTPLLVSSAPVVNAASGQGRAAPNALISIYGSGLFRPGLFYQTEGQNLSDGKIPGSAACVSVEIGGKPAPLLYVSDNQINAQAPILQGSSQPVKVTLNKGTASEKSVTGTAAYADYSPAFFVWPNSNGSIIGLILRPGGTVDLLGSPPAVPNGVAAKPGDLVVLYGTGFGFTEPVYQTGEFSSGVAPLRDPLTVRMGSAALSAADVLYAGLAPDAPGFYQFNLRVPASAPDGDLAVVATVGGASSPLATIPVKR